ncbi:MAG TPA: ATP-binding cassette domain-containing protein, partial [Microthrixaceae bacterium]|nr:ATP-binding cassette domain-containing protein [Microthrixaceae bacterium]
MSNATTNAAPTTASLAVESVSVNFGGVMALTEVSFAIPAGQVCGLIGANGASKTTLFDVINGVRVPNA